MTKQNQKFEAKFFGLFHVLHLVGKQSLKTRAANKIENPHCIPHITTRVRYHKKKADERVFTNA